MAEHVTGRTLGYDREKMLWMFDPITGCLLDLDGANSVATSFETDHTFDMAQVDDTMILTHETFMKPYLKYYGLEPIIKDKEWLEEEELLNPKNRVRATVEEKCPNCGHHQMEFYTMQLRSADEGQTVFYECKECGHKYSTNT